MYQLPVEKLDKIRQSRKRVKDILCDIGLDNCKKLLDDLKCFDAGDDCFENTDWEDLTDGYHGKRRKRWPYRREMLCCALCWFSTRSWYTFRGHVQRCHEEEEDISALSSCPNCSFISQPDVTNQHIKLFHGGSAKTTSASCTLTSTTSHTTIHSVSTTDVGDKYSCRGCGFHDSLFYVMRKHVLVNHYGSLLNRYYGHRNEAEQTADGVKLSTFFCRMCNMPAETSEHLLYHILSSDKHKELHAHIRPFIVEHVNTNLKTSIRNGPQQKLPNLAPRAVQKVVSLVSKNINQQQPNGRSISKNPSTGTMLLAAPSNTTALVCGPDQRHMFLPTQGPGGNGLILTQQAVTSLQNRAALPTSTLVKAGPIRMMLPNTQQTATKPVPITIRVPQQQQQQPRQVLLPPGVQINVQNKMGGGSQPLMLTQSGPRGAVMSSQSVRLVPTGNKVNGMPTYTLETVQVAMPVQSAGVTQIVNKGVLVTQNMTTLQQQNKPSTIIVMGNGTVSNQMPSTAVMNQTQGDNGTEKPKELAVQTQFLKKMENNTVKCTRCKTLLSEKGIFQHLLHGLQCLLCPLVFYSIQQVMEHMGKEHKLSDKANCDVLKEKYRLGINPQGSLLFPFFDMSANVPKDLLADKELNVVLVTSTKDRIYLKLRRESIKSAYQNLAEDGCPFCPEKPQNGEDYELHLKTKHHIVPTIHAILKAPAFKCVYCLGVYTDKSTSKTISIHVQRCRCAPKAAKDAERLINPDPNAQTINGGVPAAALDQSRQSRSREVTGAATKQQVGHKSKPGAFTFDPTVSLVLDPTGMEMLPFQDRKEFLTRYFHQRPYLSRKEMEALAGRLWFQRTDVASLFGAKRSRCMKALRQKKTKVLMGFNWTELSKLKHDLVVPEIEPEEKAEPGKVNTECIQSESVCKKKRGNILTKLQAVVDQFFLYNCKECLVEFKCV
uniref:ADNP homeobox 2a n=1 Tax=Salmo trutta TaxID=8032 RepID=A0A674C483_SALTR